ncbi:MAG: aryl-sulfate sulfotransferase [candidate division Zixibacteria bacterium]|nr:aryl-sulfate sulfotransferase [candidate division Zixibacteria bacterium]
MKKLRIFSAVIFLLIVLIGTLNAGYFNDTFQYISPKPGAELVSKSSNIIIRAGSILPASNFNLSAIAVIEGSSSGNHNYNAVIADDQQTIIIKPIAPFQPGETVNVILNARLITAKTNRIQSSTFSFTISPKTERLLDDSFYWDEYFDISSDLTAGSESEPNPKLNSNRDVSLPYSFPNITVNCIDNPGQGFIFLGNIFPNTAHYLMILDNTGYPVYYKEMPTAGMDFKKHDNGLLSYFLYHTRYFYVMDSTYTVVDSFRCGNGYEDYTDMHDFQILDNGHVLLAAYDPQTIDMSDIVPGGNTAACVIGYIVQELDNFKNVVFQWRSWDHFEITDAAPDINLQHYRIDYCHGNTLEPDYDGNLLISCRNMDECTKINRQTGEIIWRLGGSNNEFVFINDSRGFSHQHDIRRLSNGNITLYDNGNFHEPRYSRAIEYEIDEDNKTIAQVWEFSNTPDEFGVVMGNTQRLAGGNTFIGWGSDQPIATEVKPDGSKAFELSFDDGVKCYRSFRFPWRGIAASPYLIAENIDAGFHLVFNKFGDNRIVKYYIYMGKSPEPTTIVDSTSNTYMNIYGVRDDTTYYFRVTAVDSYSNESIFSNEVEIIADLNPIYIPGDINGDGNIINSDITFGIWYFKGTTTPPDSCWNDSTNAWLYSAADVNGDCQFSGSDIIYILRFLVGFGNPPKYCPQTPPFNEE